MLVAPFSPSQASDAGIPSVRRTTDSGRVIASTPSSNATTAQSPSRTVVPGSGSRRVPTSLLRLQDSVAKKGLSYARACDRESVPVGGAKGDGPSSVLSGMPTPQGFRPPSHQDEPGVTALNLNASAPPSPSSRINSMTESMLHSWTPLATPHQGPNTSGGVGTAASPYNLDSALAQAADQMGTARQASTSEASHMQLHLPPAQFSGDIGVPSAPGALAQSLGVSADGQSYTGAPDGLYYGPSPRAAAFPGAGSDMAAMAQRAAVFTGTGAAPGPEYWYAQAPMGAPYQYPAQFMPQFLQCQYPVNASAQLYPAVQVPHMLGNPGLMMGQFVLSLAPPVIPVMPMGMMAYPYGMQQPMQPPHVYTGMGAAAWGGGYDVASAAPPRAPPAPMASSDFSFGVQLPSEMPAAFTPSPAAGVPSAHGLLQDAPSAVSTAWNILGRITRASDEAAVARLTEEAWRAVDTHSAYISSEAASLPTVCSLAGRGGASAEGTLLASVLQLLNVTVAIEDKGGRRAQGHGRALFGYRSFLGGADAVAGGCWRLLPWLPVLHAVQPTGSPHAAKSGGRFSPSELITRAVTAADAQCDTSVLVDATRNIQAAISHAEGIRSHSAAENDDACDSARLTVAILAALSPVCTGHLCPALRKSGHGAQATELLLSLVHAVRGAHSVLTSAARPAPGLTDVMQRFIIGNSQLAQALHNAGHSCEANALVHSVWLSGADDSRLPVVAALQLCNAALLEHWDANLRGIDSIRVIDAQPIASCSPVTLRYSGCEPLHLAVAPRSDVASSRPLSLHDLLSRVLPSDARSVVVVQTGDLQEAARGALAAAVPCFEQLLALARRVTAPASASLSPASSASPTAAAGRGGSSAVPPGTANHQANQLSIALELLQAACNVSSALAGTALLLQTLGGTLGPAFSMRQAQLQGLLGAAVGHSRAQLASMLTVTGQGALALSPGTSESTLTRLLQALARCELELGIVRERLRASGCTTLAQALGATAADDAISSFVPPGLVPAFDALSRNSLAAPAGCPLRGAASLYLAAAAVGSGAPNATDSSSRVPTHLMELGNLHELRGDAPRARAAYALAAWCISDGSRAPEELYGGNAGDTAAWCSIARAAHGVLGLQCAPKRLGRFANADWRLWASPVAFEARAGSPAFVARLCETALGSTAANGRIVALAVQLQTELPVGVTIAWDGSTAAKAGQLNSDPARVATWEDFARAAAGLVAAEGTDGRLAAVVQLLLRGQRHFPKTGEIWVEAARVCLGCRGPWRDDSAPARASRHNLALRLLDAAQEFTPQFGDVYIERWRALQLGGDSPPGADSLAAIEAAAVTSPPRFGTLYQASHALPLCDDREGPAVVIRRACNLFGLAPFQPIDGAVAAGWLSNAQSGASGLAPPCYGLLRRLFGGQPVSNSSQ